MSGSGSPSIHVPSPGVRVAIVASSWHDVVMDGLIEGAERACAQAGAVPTVVRVDSPMTEEDHVVEIALFNERNPLPDIARFHLGPRCGEAWVSTRIRLGDTQTVHALARMKDGSVWAASAELIVTLPACIEG